MRVPAVVALLALSLVLAAPPVTSRPPAVGETSGYEDYVLSRGDLHMHSTNSDGAAPVSTIASVAQARNLSWVVVTDHDVVTPRVECDAVTTPTFLCIQGQEVGMSAGHITAYGITQTVPSASGSFTVADAMEEVYAQGGLAFLAHPFAEEPPGDAYGFWGVYENYTGFEVYHGYAGWNEDPAPSSDMDELAVQKWDGLLNAGRRIVGVGGSDSHDANNTWDQGDLFTRRGAIGYPRDVAYLREFSRRGVVEAIERGRLYVTDGPELEFAVQGAVSGDELRVSAGAVLTVNLTGIASVGSTVRVIANGVVAYSQAVPAGLFNLTTTYTANADAYLRAEVRTFNGNILTGETYVAFANPVYLDVPPYDELPEPPTNLAAWIEGDDVVLSWDASISADVDHYAVYRADSVGGFDFLYRHARPRITTWRDIGATWDGADHYYVVRAVDRMGHEDNNMALAAKMTFPVIPGQNLLSVPLRVRNESVASVLQTVAFASVRRFDAFDADPWKSYVPSKPWDELAALPLGCAFWVNATSAGEFVIAGTVPPVLDVPLAAGWNLVSYASHTTRTASAALAGVPYTRLEEFDPMPPYRLRVIAATDVLEPGAGLWIFASTAAVWTLGP